MMITAKDDTMKFKRKACLSGKSPARIRLIDIKKEIQTNRPRFFPERHPLEASKTRGFSCPKTINEHFTNGCGLRWLPRHCLFLHHRRLPHRRSSHPSTAVHEKRLIKGNPGYHVPTPLPVSVTNSASVGRGRTKRQRGRSIYKSKRKTIRN